MKTAIIFATTHGTSEKVANMISLKLGQENCTLINIKKSPKIDLSGYGQFVIGGSIHAGNIQSSIRNFIKQNTSSILEKRVALYLCYMNEPDFDSQIERAFPENIRNHALSIKGVGGEFVIEKMNFMQRFLVRKISGVTESTSKINETNIDQLVLELSSK